MLVSRNCGNGGILSMIVLFAVVIHDISAIPECTEADADGCDFLVSKGLCTETSYSTWMESACRGACGLCGVNAPTTALYHSSTPSQAPISPAPSSHPTATPSRHPATTPPTPRPSPAPVKRTNMCQGCDYGVGPCQSKMEGHCSNFQDTTAKLCASGFRECAFGNRKPICNDCAHETSGECQNSETGRCISFVSFGKCIDGYSPCVISDEAESREGLSKLGVAATSAVRVGWKEGTCRLLESRVLDCSTRELELIPSNTPTLLVHFWASANQIRRVDSSDFAGMSLLKHLYLSENLISTIGVGAFDSLVSLDVALLDNNLLTGLPLGLFMHCTSLRVLDLRQNQLSILTPTTFLGLAHLTNLNLFGNAIREIACGALNHLQASVQHFNMNSNPSTCAPRSDLKVQCECVRGFDLTGAVNGRCSEENTCAWLQPVFSNVLLPTTTTTSTPPETIQAFHFVKIQPENKKYPNNFNPGPQNTSARVSGDSSSSSDGQPGVATIMGSVLAGVVAVVAIAAVAMRAKRKNSSAVLDKANTMSATTSSWTRNSTGVSLSEYDEDWGSVHRKWGLNISKLSRNTTAESDIWNDRTPSPDQLNPNFMHEQYLEVAEAQ